MTVDYKTLIKNELASLKKLGKDRRTIETELDYSENYLDQTLSKGGNEKVHQALVRYRENLEAGDDQNSYKRLSLAASQQDTIDRMTRMLEREQSKNHELQDRVFELQNRLIEVSNNRQTRRSA